MAQIDKPVAAERLIVAAIAKHAQRDPLATMDDTDLDPDGVIVHALSAYSMTDPGKGLPDSVRPFLERHGLM
jgi:hypothetical protein